MRKLICILICSLLYLFFCGQYYSADEEELISRLESEAGEINENLPDEVNDFLDDNDISVEDTEKMTSITPGDVFRYILGEFKTKLKMPLKTLACLLGAVLISSLAGSMGDTITNKSLTRIYEVITVIITVGVICNPISQCIKNTATTLSQGSNFMIGYIPIFAGITASSGNVTSAVSYNSIVLIVAEIAVQLASNYLMPMLSICMALGIVEAINPTFNLSGITKAIKKAASFLICFVMTIFVGLLSIQSIVGVSADTLGVKAAKFMVSNFIPVVGGAVADAYTTLRSSLGLLRGGVGFIGIISISLLVLPTILEITAMRAVIFIGDILSDMFGLPQIKVLMKNTSQILALAFSILVCFFIILVISTTILMMVGLNIS